MQIAIAIVVSLATIVTGSRDQANLERMPSPSPVQAMPADRENDSYLIYSGLLPLGETKSWPATFFAVRSATITAVKPEQACSLPRDLPANFDAGMNPHTAVKPSVDAREDYEQMLDDFDKHCHERLALRATHWTATRIPIHLLNEAEQAEYAATHRAANATKYNGSPSLYAFSQVYFNAHHTMAMV